jgi:hypothetical protein
MAYLGVNLIGSITYGEELYFFMSWKGINGQLIAPVMFIGIVISLFIILEQLTFIKLKWLGYENVVDILKGNKSSEIDIEEPILSLRGGGIILSKIHETNVELRKVLTDPPPEYYEIENEEYSNSWRYLTIIGGIAFNLCAGNQYL